MYQRPSYSWGGKRSDPVRVWRKEDLATEKGIMEVVYWKKAQPGEWAESDDKWCLRVKKIDGDWMEFEGGYVANFSTQYFQIGPMPPWLQKEIRSKRFRRFVRTYVGMMMALQGRNFTREEWDTLGAEAGLDPKGPGSTEWDTTWGIIEEDLDVEQPIRLRNSDPMAKD